MLSETEFHKCEASLKRVCKLLDGIMHLRYLQGSGPWNLASYLLHLWSLVWWLERTEFDKAGVDLASGLQLALF